MPANRIAIVTGANRGLGLEIARQLVANDVFVVAGCRDAAKCEATVETLRAEGDHVAAHVLDVNDTHSVRALVEAVSRQHGAPSILVNNAGVFPEERGARLTDLSTAYWRMTFETNVFGAMRMCREVVPHMLRLRYGRVVNISSGLGQMSRMAAGTPAYRASKAALNAITLTLADEVRGTGILVNSMSPGWVRTDMGGPEAPGSVQEGADTAVWLCLLPSSGPTGQFFRNREAIPW